MDIKGKEKPAPTGLNWRDKPRRTFTPEERLAMVRECEASGVSVAEVAQRNRVNTNLLFKWRRMHQRGLLPMPESSTALVLVTVFAPRLPPSCPPRRSFVASDARRRGQLCTVPTRPESTYKSGKPVQTTGATSLLHLRYENHGRMFKAGGIPLVVEGSDGGRFTDYATFVS